MKLILEDSDIIIIDQDGDRYGSSITCKIAEKDETGNWIKIEKMQARSLFEKVCNVKDGRAVLYYVIGLLGFENHKYGNQRAQIKIKSSTKGLLLEINNKLFTPKELNELADLNEIDGQLKV